LSILIVLEPDQDAIIGDVKGEVVSNRGPKHAVGERLPRRNINCRLTVFRADNDERAFAEASFIQRRTICAIDLSTKLMALARPSLGVAAPWLGVFAGLR
jgi:hypothetical protein